MISDKNQFDIDSFFDEFLESPQLFKDRDVLSATHIPNQLPHRNLQIKFIAEILAVTLKKSTPSNFFMYGKTGTGKTASVRYVGRKLIDKCQDLPQLVVPCWIYVNCNEVKTGYRVLATICNNLDPKDPVPPTGLPRDVLIEELKKRLENKAAKSVCFVILDEIDCLKSKNSKDNILYVLSRMNESLESSSINLIGISNILSFKDDLDPRVVSSLCEEEIVFPAYNARELYDILKARCDLAFNEGVVQEGALRLCSALAATESGDARRALSLLRKAAEIAERRKLHQITVDQIYDAKSQLDNDRIVTFIQDLPAQQKAVLLSVFLNHAHKKGAKSSTGEIYNTYCELLKQQYGLDSLTRRRVTDLVKELDLAGITTSKVVSFGRKGGRTRMIGLNSDIEQIKKSFDNDNQWGSLLSYVPSYIRRQDVNLYQGKKYKSLL